MGFLFAKPLDQGVVLNFEKVQLSNAETKVHEEVEDVLSRGPRVLKVLQDYKGCKDLTKKAMSSSAKEAQQEAFEGLLKAVEDIHSFYRFAKKLEETVPKIFDVLATNEPKAALKEHQGLTKQLGDIFCFALEFDQTRMQRPTISNDFSYYRRLLPKFADHPDIKVSDDEANLMALFTAEHIPMITCLTSATNASVEKNPNVKTLLAVFANSCHTMLEQKVDRKKEINSFIIKAMVGAIILYDHVDNQGAFHKNSPIAIYECISVTIKHPDCENRDGLLNSMRYSTLHFNDDSTPSGVKKLLE